MSVLRLKTATALNGGSIDVLKSELTSILKAQMMADSPSALYLLNETSGTVMADSSGNGQNGTYYGTATLGQAAIIANEGLSVTSGPSGIGYLDSASWMNGTRFTAEALVLPTSVTSYCNVMGRDTMSQPNRQFHFLYRDGNSEAEMWDANGNFAGCTSSATIAASTATLVALVYDGSTLKQYKNGVQSSTANVAAGWRSVNTYLHIGSGGGGGALHPWQGRMSHVAFYSAAISSTRLRAHATALGLS